MLDRMPVADEETVRNRRARFRVEDVRLLGKAEVGVWEVIHSDFLLLLPWTGGLLPHGTSSTCL